MTATTSLHSSLYPHTLKAYNPHPNRPHSIGNAYSVRTALPFPATQRNDKRKQSAHIYKLKTRVHGSDKPTPQKRTRPKNAGGVLRQRRCVLFFLNMGLEI